MNKPSELSHSSYSISSKLFSISVALFWILTLPVTKRCPSRAEKYFSDSPPVFLMRISLEEKKTKPNKPGVCHMDYYLHKCSSDCRAQMRMLFTKRKPFSWIDVSPVLAQPDTNSSEALSDGERKPAANATRQDRSLSAKCSELQLATSLEELAVPGVKTGQECGSCLQCHSSDLAHLCQLSLILYL